MIFWNIIKLIHNMNNKKLSHKRIIEKNFIDN